MSPTLLFADAYVHRLDPFAIQFTETIGLRWYGLSYAAGFLIAWWLVHRLARTGRSPLTGAQVGDLMFYIIAGVLIGGRLGYVAFYEPSLIGFSSQFPYWNVLAITKGGMASHGGMIGATVACLLFARRARVSALHTLDLTVFVCPPGLFLGRLANFINAELWGKPLPEAMQAAPPWWGVKYPQEILRWNPARPEDAERLAVIDPLHVTIGGDETFRLEVMKATIEGREGVAEIVEPVLTAYYPSQIFQALTDGPILFGVLVLVWLRPRRPGVVGSWFLLAYGLLRIASEWFRQPDEGVALYLGLSRGQGLSVLLVLTGIVCVIVCSRRNVPRMGGLGKTVSR